jgi:hypothetical protein
MKNAPAEAKRYIESFNKPQAIPEPIMSTIDEKVEVAPIPVQEEKPIESET